MGEFRDWLKNYKEAFERDKHGQTRMHLLASSDKIEEIEKIVKMGADVNATDHAGWTPLHEAALVGKDEVVRTLIKVVAFFPSAKKSSKFFSGSCPQLGAKVNLKSKNGDTPLHDAAENGHASTVRLLVESKADIFAQNRFGDTPVDVAKDDPEILQALGVGGGTHDLFVPFTNVLSLRHDQECRSPTCAHIVFAGCYLCCSVCADQAKEEQVSVVVASYQGQVVARQ